MTSTFLIKFCVDLHFDVNRYKVNLKVKISHVWPWQDVETPCAISMLLLYYCIEFNINQNYIELTSNSDIVLEDAIGLCRFLPHDIDVGGIIIDG